MNLISIFNAYGSGTRRVRAGLGPELVLNPGFDGSGGWVFQPNAMETGGYLDWNVVVDNSNTSQNVHLKEGKLYRCEFTIVVITLGGVKIMCGITMGIVRNTAETYIQELVCVASENLSLRAVGASSCHIDNVSVKEILYRDEDE